MMFDEAASKCNGMSYYKDYLTMKSVPGGSGGSTKSYSGVTVPFLKLAEAPFGYRPTSANYKFDVLIQSAKKTYGWDISKLDVGGYGFVWPQLNGMKFLNFPVYRLVANAYALYDNTDIGNMLCEIVCSKQEVSKARASLKKLLLSNGWTLHKSGTYYKGKVYIEVQEEENKKFPGKVILNITSVIYPGPYPLKEFLGNGQG